MITTFVGCGFSSRKVFGLEKSEYEMIYADAYKWLARERVGVSVDLDDVKKLVQCQVDALNRGERDDNPWDRMWSTKLYNEQSCAYCSLLEFVHQHPIIQRMERAVIEEWEREQEQEWENERLNAMYCCGAID